MKIERKGELFIFGETLLWSVFPIITTLSYVSLSPLVSLAWSTLFAAVFFALVLFVRHGWPQLKVTAALIDILWGTLFIGVVFYVFFFLGLKYTTPGNASIIALMETFYSYLFFNVWKKEYLSPRSLVGIALMLLGALIILFPSFSGSFNFGDLLIFVGMAAAPVGNYFQRRARERVSSEAILFVRSLVAAPVIFVLAYLFGAPASLHLSGRILVLLLGNGIFLFGLSKLFWLEGIHRISVVEANAFHSVGPLFTLFFAWLFLAQPSTPLQLAAFAPMCIGVVLLSSTPKKYTVP